MNDEAQKIIEERFNTLPKPVQEAITSAKMNEQLRNMEKKYGLHVDQWAKLENQIMMTVLGISSPETLVDDVVQEVGIDKTQAQTIVDDVAVTIFKPIREELERQLEHPDAKAEEVSDVDAVRTQMLGDAASAQAATPAVQSTTLPGPSPIGATPPPEPPTEKAIRAPISESYKAGEPSTARKTVHDDPYREPPA